MTKNLLVFVFIFCSVFSFSQESKVIDSLKREMVNTSNDTIRAIILNKISGQYWNGNPDSCFYYANKSYKTSLNSNYTSGIVNSLISIGVSFELKKDFKNAIIYYKKAIEESKKGKIKTGILANIYYNLGNAYIQKGEKNNALKAYYNSISLYKKLNRNATIAKINLNIGIIFQDKMEFNKAINLYNESLKIFNENNNISSVGVVYERKGVCYQNLKEYDKALEYFNKSIEISIKTKNLFQQAIALINLGGVYGEIGKYKLSENSFLEAKNIFEKLNLKSEIIVCDINLARLANIRKDFKLAETITDQYINIENITLDQKLYLMRINGFSKLNLKKNNEAKAICKRAYFLALKNDFKDELIDVGDLYIQTIINNDEFGKKCFEKFKEFKDYKYSKQNKMNFLELDVKYLTKEKEAKIKEQQLLLQKEKANRNMALAGIAGLVLLSAGGLWFYRTKQKQNQLQTQNTLLGLQQNLTAMQLDNLNKQLDPHEIKNILANISPEIQRNAPDAYNKMTKLLNLTRASLSNNSVTDSIENQLQQIEDYLSLEKTVLPVPLQYSILNTVDTTKQIPRLLLKNLVENSIKHGIKNKKEGGEININISEKDNTIFIEIDDTGIGRKQAISLDSGIGTSTYINLFETLNKTNTQKASFNIIDKENGTKVEVYIPTDYKYS